MSLDSAGTMLAAWVAVPLLLAALAAGMGQLVAVLCRCRLGLMTLPAGFLAAIVAVTALMRIGLSGRAAAWVLAGVALLGLAALARDRRWATPAAAVAALAALAAYGIGIAPVVMSGRVALLGYVLNNDPAIHLAVLDLLREHGTSPPAGPPSSYLSVAGLITGGYPLGSYAWPLLASGLSGLSPLALWTPTLAFVAAMTALVAAHVLRAVGVAARWAAALGVVVASGYLPYSFLAQGGLKETTTSLCVYAAVALAVGPPPGPSTWRRAIPAALALIAGLFVFGVGIGAWLGPALVALAIGLGWRLRSRRPSRRAIALGAGGLALVVVALLPFVEQGLSFVRGSDATLRNPAQFGNLLGPVPWREALNVWLSRDYRVQPPDAVLLTDIGWIGALALAVLGLVWAARRRGWALVVSLVAGIAGAVVISSRYSIYLEAKSLVALAPALGMASAAGAYAVGARWGALRWAAAGLLTVGVLASAALVYRGVWLTPGARFEELARIDDRFAGRGPILVNEREQYSIYLLRRVQPWESWGTYQPMRGFVSGETFPVPPPHTPDFDDYSPSFVQRFPLLLERRRPGGSRPPTNYAPVYQTASYRVWRRTAAPAPAEHLGLGASRASGAARVDCRAATVRRLLARARQGKGLTLSTPAARLFVVARARDWSGYGGYPVPPPVGMITRFGGGSFRRLAISPGRYSAWIQGSFGPGARLYVGDTRVGYVHDDLGSPDGWQRFGDVTIGRGRSPVALVGAVERRWRPGSGHFDINGATVLVSRADPGHRLVRIPARRARAVCGRRVDWLELPR